MSGRKLWKKEFDDMIYQKLKELGHPCTRLDVYWMSKAYADCLVDLIANGDSTTVSGKYTLEPKLIKEKKTGNFGNPITIPAHYVPCFKAGRLMKEACEELMENERQQEEE